MRNIYIIHAKYPYYVTNKKDKGWHHFIECFTSKRMIVRFLDKHPTVVIKETTFHEINPK